MMSNFTHPLALDNINQGSDLNLKDENSTQDGEETFKLTR